MNDGGGARARRGAIDIARSSSLALVVVAHLTMVVLDRAPDGSLRGVNLFELYPRFEWITMLSPMPLFFVASGWANVGSSLASRMRRVVVLLALATVVAAGWSLAALVERAVTGGNGIVADGSRIATQPLWFLTAWIPFTVFSDVLTRAARRIIPTVGTCLLLLVVTDVVRFVAGAPRWIGYPGFFIAWAVPWLMGAWWRQRHDTSPIHEGRTGRAIAGGSIAVAVVLVAFFSYHPALIDAVPGHRSNTTPPTLFTGVASLVQVGLFIILARSLDAVAARRDQTIRSLDAIAPGLYVWHLTALSLWGALLAAGAWAPDRLSWQWWASRPLWFAAVIATSIAFSLATRRLTTRLVSMPVRADAGRNGVVLVPTLVATVAFGLVGLYGPDTTGMAITVTALCAVACGVMVAGVRDTKTIS